MAGSSETSSAYRMESELRDESLATMEAEQRTVLLDQMVRLGMNLGDVQGIFEKQLVTRRCNKGDDTDQVLMEKKLKDSRKEEKLFRRKRNNLRVGLEEVLGKNSNKYKRIIERVKQLVEKKRTKIRKKYKNKVETYKEKHEKAKAEKIISSLPEEVKPYKDLRAIRGLPIDPDPPKPPVITSPEIVLSKEEIKILSKSPKFTLRNILDKEQFMIEVEKTLIKEQYRRIGKDETNGVVVEENFENSDEVKRAENAKWLEMKGEIIYDFEDNNIDFGRSKPTRWKGNKRITLPKSGSASLEAYLEIRRQEMSRTFDECMEILGEGDKTGYNNLDMEERQGLKSLKDRVKAGDIIICATDKSGRFAVLSRKQYIEAGEEHTKNDKEINLEESKAVERELNGHMRWWADMTGLGEQLDQKDRSVRNLLNHGLATRTTKPGL